MKVTHDHKHGDSEQEKRDHVGEEDESCVEIAASISEPRKAVGCRGRDHQCEGCCHNSDEDTVKEIGQEMGIFKEIDVIGEDETARQYPGGIPEDFTIRLHGAEKGPDQGREDEQGDQDRREIGEDQVQSFRHGKISTQMGHSFSWRGSKIL